MENKIKYLLLFFVLILFTVRTFANEIEFSQGTYNDVLTKAKNENKILMIDFMTDWCKWCVELDKKVYTNSEVAAFANKHQVNWKIDAEKGEGPDLAKKFNVSGYPTIVFVNGNGEEIDRIVGYLPAKGFLAAITDFNAGKNTMGYFKAILEKDPSDPVANYKIGKKYFEYGDKESAKPYFDKVLTSDPANKSGFTDDASLMIAQMSEKPEQVEAFIVTFPDSDQMKLAYLALAEVAYQSMNDMAKAQSGYDKVFTLYGKNDEEVNQSYSQFLIAQLYLLSKNKTNPEADLKKGLVTAGECLEYVRGSVNEASVYYYISEIYNQLGEKQNANDAIDNAIKINPTKNFQKQKEKINGAVKDN
jgi:thioredoxin-related protein